MRWKIYFQEKAASSMDAMKVLARKGGAEGQVLYVGNQDSGRGRHERKWVSFEGGLYCSILLKPKWDIQDIPKMTLLVAVAVCEAIRKTSGVRTKIKWPNDILITGKKVAGLLLEQTGTRVFIGFGINISQHAFPEDIRQRATSLTRHTLRPPGPDQLVESVLHSISEAYRSARWLSDAEARLWSLGARVPFRASSFPFDVTGTIDGLERDGALRVTGVAEADRGGVRFPGAFPEPWLCYSGEIHRWPARLKEPLV